MFSIRLLHVAIPLTAFGALHCGPDGSTSEPPGGQGGNYIVVGAGGGPGPGAGGGPGPGAGGGPQPPGGGGASPGGAGNGGSGSGGAGNVGVDPVGNANRAPGFVDLSPPMGAPLDDQGTALTPPAPTGWVWHPIQGAICRDGSPTGFFVHKGTANQLLIYLEGGGACSNDHFCAFNPQSANHILAGDGSSVLGSTLGSGPGRQQPGGYTDGGHVGPPAGIFDTANAANPFKDWSQIYVPYCTGDVHYGKRQNATVPNLPPQQFVGGTNMELFIGRIVPTFKPTVTRVVLTGSSAGGFGTALNFSMVQDAFGDVPVLPLDDSGPPFEDQYMPVCMQKKWREGWGFVFPPDCNECKQADGGGMLGLADFVIRKHPNAKIGMISSVEDEVIRLFYSVGLKDCSTYETADPVAIFLGGIDPTLYYPAAQYTAGLNAIRTKYVSTGRLATFFMPGLLHQHLFRPSFYTATAGGVTLPQWVQGFLDGQSQQVGP